MWPCGGSGLVHRRATARTQMGNMVVSVSTNLSKPCGELGGSGTAANDSVEPHGPPRARSCCLDIEVRA